MVRFLLIGAGGAGTAGTNIVGGAGGGSGAITTWIGPAIFVPDELQVGVGAGGQTSGIGGGASAIVWQGPSASAGYTLLTARGGGLSGAAATATANNYFGASGIYNNIVGQAGAAAGVNLDASLTTFLSGGAGGASTTTTAGGSVTAKYGYPTLAGGTGSSAGIGKSGYFITQPLLLGTGGSGGGGGLSPTTGGAGGKGGIGCGGGGGGRGSAAGGAHGIGGNGAVFIWSW